MIFNQKSRLKFCVVTGGRAEYGLLHWLMKEIQSDADLDLQVITTGMHLAREQGETWKQIEADGIRIDAKVDLDLSDDSDVGVARSTGLAVFGIAKELARLGPDVVIVLGDRYEILGAATASLLCRIPLAHLHGGETTEGAMDESIRHAITKLAHFHFVAAEPYRKRVVRMGEDPSRVWNVGALGFDAIRKTPRSTEAEFEKKFGFRFRSPSFLVTYHPATLEAGSVEEQCRSLLGALDVFPDASILFTKANADQGGKIVNRLVEEYAAARAARGSPTVVQSALGSSGYLTALERVDVVIGNSSSGVIEAPFFGKPTVNVGSRQRGRLMADSILNADPEANDIAAKIRTSLSPEFRAKAAAVKSLYGTGEASRKIRETLKNELSRRPRAEILQKTFHDGDDR